MPHRTIAHRLLRKGQRFGRDQHGATAIEYGLLAAMITVFLVAIGTLGSNLSSGVYIRTSDAMESAVSRVP